MLPSILSCKTFISEQVLIQFTYFCDIKHSKSDCFSCQNTEVNFWVPMQRYVLLILKWQCCYTYQRFSTKICRGKIPEKIWLNIKHFIKRKIKIKIVSFLSRQSLVGKQMARNDPKTAIYQLQLLVISLCVSQARTCLQFYNLAEIKEIIFLSDFI